MFGRRGQTEMAKLPTIVVPRSALESDQSRSPALASAVVDFVNFATNQAHFLRDELPVEALQAFIDYYIAQVNNGGHCQFVGNSHWHDYVINDIRNGLAAIGHVEAQELFADLCDYAERRPEEFMEGMRAGGFGKYPEFFSQLDSVFFAGLGNSLSISVDRWLRSLDCLLVLDDEAFREALNALPDRNPHRAKREAEHQRLVAESREKDPVIQACKYVCALAEHDRIEFEHWRTFSIEESTTDLRGGAFHFVAGDSRRGVILFFPTVVALYMGDPSNPTVQVPIGMVQEYVHRKTGQYVPEWAFGAR